MVKIEIVFVPEENLEESTKIRRVAVNGIVDYNSICFVGTIKYPSYAHLYDSEVISQFFEATVDEVKTFFPELSLHQVFLLEQFKVNVLILVDHKNSNFFPSNEIAFILHIDYEKWTRPYSIRDLYNELKVRTATTAYKFFSDHGDNPINGFGITFNFKETNLTVGSLIKTFKDQFNKIVTDAIFSLVNASDKDVLTTIFRFPDSLKTVCKQYLIYFAQFLLDLGIEADTEFSDEANGTLFKVIPKNSDEGLQNIKEALDIYINAPSAPTVAVEVIPGNDIAVMQWQANVMHLQSQLLLIKSTIQAKDATIESLQLSNYQYKQIITAKEKEETKSEDIILGVVSVSKIESHGFALNLAELLRRLKRSYNK